MSRRVTTPTLSSFKRMGALGAGVFGSLQAEAADCGQQDIGQAGEQQAEPVGPPAVARGAVGEQLELLLLDAVLHLAAGAVEAVVEGLAVALQIGHHEARIGVLGAALEAGDDPAFPGPALRAVAKLGEPLLLAAGFNAGSTPTLRRVQLRPKCSMIAAAYLMPWMYFSIWMFSSGA